MSNTSNHHSSLSFGDLQKGDVFLDGEGCLSRVTDPGHEGSYEYIHPDTGNYNFVIGVSAQAWVDPTGRLDPSDIQVWLQKQIPGNARLEQAYRDRVRSWHEESLAPHAVSLKFPCEVRDLPVGTVFFDDRGDLAYRKGEEGVVWLDMHHLRESIGCHYDDYYPKATSLADRDWALEWLEAEDLPPEDREVAKGIVLSWFGDDTSEPTVTSPSPVELALREGLLKAVAALERYPEQRILQGELLRLLLDNSPEGQP